MQFLGMGVMKMQTEEQKNKTAFALAESRRLRQEMRQQFHDRTVTVLSAALGVVAGLFWQTAITDTIKAFIPVSGAWPYEIVVALVVTVLAALVLFTLTRNTSKLPEQTSP